MNVHVTLVAVVVLTLIHYAFAITPRDYALPDTEQIRAILTSSTCLRGCAAEAGCDSVTPEELPEKMCECNNPPTSSFISCLQGEKYNCTSEMPQLRTRYFDPWQVVLMFQQDVCTDKPGVPPSTALSQVPNLISTNSLYSGFSNPYCVYHCGLSDAGACSRNKSESEIFCSDCAQTISASCMLEKCSASFSLFQNNLNKFCRKKRSIRARNTDESHADNVAITDNVVINSYYYAPGVFVVVSVLRLSFANFVVPFVAANDKVQRRLHWCTFYLYGAFLYYFGLIHSGISLRVSAKARLNKQLLMTNPALSAQTPPIIEIARDEAEYVYLENMFIVGWLHPEKSKPEVLKIWKVCMDSKTYQQYERYCKGLQDYDIPSAWRRPGKQRLLYHGTRRNCEIGNISTNTAICSDMRCSLCRIISGSFDVAYSRRGGMFGTGIYTSPVSSKSDRYSRNRPSNPKAMLLNAVAVGKQCPLKYADHNLTAPPEGYNSVTGVWGTGANLRYEEVIVYSNQAICPKYLIIYQTTGA